MEEIEFRAWDKEMKEMFTMEQVNNNLGSYFNYTSKTYLVGEEFIHRFIQMQYTGLRDNKRTEEYPKGQKIYKGDIVSAFNGKIKAEIIRGYCGFEFKWLNDTGIIRNRISEEMFKNTSLIFEVIGNIYENPELLEE